MDPAPGTTPTFGSGNANCACSAAMRMSVACSNSAPPPSARPFTAAITGLYNGSALSMIWSTIIGSDSKRSSCGVCGFLAPVHNGMICDKSPPQQKSSSPAAVSTATRMASSSRTSCQASANSTNMSPLIMFLAAGRLSVIQACCPRFSNTTLLITSLPKYG